MVLGRGVRTRRMHTFSRPPKSAQKPQTPPENWVQLLQRLHVKLTGVDQGPYHTTPERLLKAADELGAIRREYCDYKTKYETVQKRLEDATTRVQRLNSLHEASARDLLEVQQRNLHLKAAMRHLKSSDRTNLQGVLERTGHGPSCT